MPRGAVWGQDLHSEQSHSAAIEIRSVSARHDRRTCACGVERTTVRHRRGLRRRNSQTDGLQGGARLGSERMSACVTAADLAARLKLHRSRDEWRGTVSGLRISRSLRAECQQGRPAPRLVRVLPGQGRRSRNCWRRCKAVPQHRNASSDTTPRPKWPGRSSGPCRCGTAPSQCRHARRALPHRTRSAASRRISCPALPSGLPASEPLPTARADRTGAGRRRRPGRHSSHVPAA